MVQVQELLDKTQIDGPIVATNFIFRRVQPCKERVHPMYEYSGSDDATQETSEQLPSEEIDRWLAQLFDLAGYRLLPNAMRAYKLASPPTRTGQRYTSPMCPLMTGQPAWMPGRPVRNADKG